MNTIDDLRPEIDKQKAFLAEWIDRKLTTEQLGPACLAMLEIAIERSITFMGRTYATNLVVTTLHDLKIRAKRSTGR